MQDVDLIASIPQIHQGKRLDLVLSLIFPEHSRERLKSWILSGECLINGQISRPANKILGNEQVKIKAKIEPVCDNWLPEEGFLQILHEDSEILVLNKPAKLVVHPAAGNYTGTLVNFLLNHDSNLECLPRAGVVHRLDKDTTGVMVVAKTLEAHTYLVSELQARRIKREYIALVEGIVTAGGTISAPIDRHPIDRKKQAVVKNGKPAVTHYRLLQKFEKFTLLKCELETGRTHQIRVHMKHIRHPIVGDQTYKGRVHLPGQYPFKRQALHAQRLTLTHPVTKEIMAFEAPIPDDIQDLLKFLEK